MPTRLRSEVSRIQRGADGPAAVFLLDRGAHPHEAVVHPREHGGDRAGGRVKAIDRVVVEVDHPAADPQDRRVEFADAHRGIGFDREFAAEHRAEHAVQSLGRAALAALVDRQAVDHQLRLLAHLGQHVGFDLVRGELPGQHRRRQGREQDGAAEGGNQFGAQRPVAGGALRVGVGFVHGRVVRPSGRGWKPTFKPRANRDCDVWMRTRRPHGPLAAGFRRRPAGPRRRAGAPRLRARSVTAPR